MLSFFNTRLFILIYISRSSKRYNLNYIFSLCVYPITYPLNLFVNSFYFSLLLFYCFNLILSLASNKSANKIYQFPHDILHTLGAGDLSCVVSGFGQVLKNEPRGFFLAASLLVSSAEGRRRVGLRPTKLLVTREKKSLVPWVYFTQPRCKILLTLLSISVSCFSIRIILVPASCVSYTAAP